MCAILCAHSESPHSRKSSAHGFGALRDLEEWENISRTGRDPFDSVRHAISILVGRVVGLRAALQRGHDVRSDVVIEIQYTERQRALGCDIAQFGSGVEDSVLDGRHGA